MAVTTESLSAYSPGVCVCIDVAVVAYGTGVGVPTALILAHELSHVRLWICSPYSVRVDMTRDASRVSPLSIMTGSTAFDVASSEHRMPSSTGTDAERHEAGSFVPHRLDARLENVPLLMARAAEGLLRVATCAIGRPGLRVDSVRKSVVEVVDHLEIHLVRGVARHAPR